MPQVERTREIKRRRQRRDKVHELRARLATERDAKVRARLLAKLKKVSPATPAPEK
jgi:hypothetical protein